MGAAAAVAAAVVEPARVSFCFWLLLLLLLSASVCVSLVDATPMIGISLIDCCCKTHLLV